MSTKYETMYILRPDLTDEIIDQTITRYQTLLAEQGAAPVETQHRGKRRLAYELKKFKEGIYVQMNYDAPTTAVAELEKAFRLSEEVIRFLTVREED
ncbi:30S ribosomal protein S6 [Gloeobacter violaceus]|uniref:Small ribosomal subunit protein bS6 n=1 Tax=Gloeobacter violaceus (strain ATCC 29082 / PCC 7421) TaxID=251221 RepID=RS6_GLOVI|nr:30S ribosomal protein S6 [Gloeobacter violaceus]Q7NNH7.1 RecName: Full=Small ribosomal subunit protein bS6; AltName: Full=30S ribosomal protein S6 [Gloeobacter violaceus PCC 7421]BAC88375.1 30S ribosomal protein S6 [Gloeobacter violaceus PCC 7421]